MGEDGRSCCRDGSGGTLYECGACGQKSALHADHFRCALQGGIPVGGGPSDRIYGYDEDCAGDSVKSTSRTQQQKLLR